MKSLLTKLTESVDIAISSSINANIIEKLSVSPYTETMVDMGVFMSGLKKEDPDLFKKMEEYIKNSKEYKKAEVKKPKKNNNNRSSSSSGSSSSSSYSCGRSYSSSCGRSSGYSSSCGRSSRGGC